MLAFLVLFTVCVLAWLEERYWQAEQRRKQSRENAALQRLLDYDVRKWPPLRKY